MLSKIHDFINARQETGVIVDVENPELVRIYNECDVTVNDEPARDHHGYIVGDDPRYTRKEGFVIGFSGALEPRDGATDFVDTTIYELSEYFLAAKDWVFYFKSEVTDNCYDSTAKIQSKTFIGFYTEGAPRKDPRRRYYVPKVKIHGKKVWEFKKFPEYANPHATLGVEDAFFEYSWLHPLLFGETVIRRSDKGKYYISLDGVEFAPMLERRTKKEYRKVWEDAEESPDGMRMIPAGYRDSLVTVDDSVYGPRVPCSVDEVPGLTSNEYTYLKKYAEGGGFAQFEREKDELHSADFQFEEKYQAQLESLKSVPILGKQFDTRPPEKKLEFWR